MGGVRELLEEARAAGLEVWAEGDRLLVAGPRHCAGLARRLLDAKAEMLAVLGNESANSEPEEPSADAFAASLSLGAAERQVEDSGLGAVPVSVISCETAASGVATDRTEGTLDPEAAAHPATERLRQELTDWALSHGCPLLRFAPGGEIHGTPGSWLDFLDCASDQELHAVWLAIGQEHRQ